MAILDYSLSRTVDPSSEPLTVSEAKTHLRVSGSDSDSYITTLIEVARRQFENDARLGIITQTWTQKLLNGFPPSGIIQLNMSPVASVSYVQYVDIDGVTQTLTSADYDVDLTRRVIWLGYQKSWPSTRDVQDSVTITFVCGASSANAAHKQAMNFLIAHWFENREAFSTSWVSDFHECPYAYQVLVSQLQTASYP